MPEIYHWPKVFSGGGFVASAGQSVVNLAVSLFSVGWGSHSIGRTLLGPDLVVPILCYMMDCFDKNIFA